MKLQLVLMGKTNKKYLEEGISLYSERINNFLPFEMVVLKDVANAKNLSIGELKEKEALVLERILQKAGSVILLSEEGKELSSVGFSKFVSAKIDIGTKDLTFVVGGAYGFSDYLRDKYKEKLSLSKMTFSHQMVRLFFTEQLYRSLTIIKGMPYHHM